MAEANQRALGSGPLALKSSSLAVVLRNGRLLTFKHFMIHLLLRMTYRIAAFHYSRLSLSYKSSR